MRTCVGEVQHGQDDVEPCGLLDADEHSDPSRMTRMPPIVLYGQVLSAGQKTAR